jgi:hypothetical protein
MTIQIKHSKVSAKGDGGDATLIRPTDWNAVHTTTMAAGNLLGRLTAGPGSFEEIPISAYMAALLASADKDALADAIGIFTTGDVKWSYDTTASAGWVAITNVTGSIGNAASAATMRANADTQSLFEMLYNNITDSFAPVSGGRTGNATNDFNAGKRLTINLTGRSPVASGVGGGGIATRDLGQTGGAETHVLTVGELAQHSHGVTDPGHIHNFSNGGPIVTGGALLVASGSGHTMQGTTILSAVTGITINNTGSGTAHNNLHPYIALVAHVKL